MCVHALIEVNASGLVYTYAHANITCSLECSHVLSAVCIIHGNYGHYRIYRDIVYMYMYIHMFTLVVSRG